MKYVRTSGEYWLIRKSRRGWIAECDNLEMRLTAETETLLMVEIEEAMAMLAVVA